MSPRKPGTPCPAPGCPAVTPPGEYCDGHQGTGHRRKDERRPSAAERGYDYRWQKASRYYRSKNPLCRMCKDEGRTREGDVVDHITPLPEGDKYDEDNLQTLCHMHHNRKHGAGV